MRLVLSVLAVLTQLVTFPAGLATPPASDVQDWKPVAGRLMTRWAVDVSSTSPHSEYPRPMMVRDRWQSLNGLWQFAIVEGDTTTGPPAAYDGRILVPFPLESALSGVGKTLDPSQLLWYRRTFTVPADWANQNILLHFGAVDWECEVRLNGRTIGTHKGGYDPFSINITFHVDRAKENELVVIVRDPTDEGGQPRGKQVRSPEGIWYTRISGIWQTVWIEPVPSNYIETLHVRGDAAGKRIVVEAKSSGTEPPLLLVELLQDGMKIAQDVPQRGLPAAINVPNPRLWTPDDPHLYDVRVSLIAADGTKDVVNTYAALRDVRIGPDKVGVQRILLNGEPLFQFGPLDQGFWPDGLYTPPTDEAMKFDIETVKKMGCNMLRKHVKVESQRFYHWCDKLGVLVWQDIPSANNPAESPAARPQFEAETKSIIAAFRNHPSIIMWVPFNEGWGQYDTQRVVEMVAKEDPKRLVNNASGWTDTGVGDVIDVHVYPGPGMAPAEARRASVLGEYGGLGLPVEGHTWVDKNNWGYVSYKSPEELTEAYLALIDKMKPLIVQGLSAAVYTQLTDVEIEVNGWLTYDRAKFKIDPDRAAAAARSLYAEQGSLQTIVPTSAQHKQSWRYTTSEPVDDWMSANFDDSKWMLASGGFGAEGTPGASIGTDWKSEDIWIRRSVDLNEPFDDLMLLIHHDEDAEVFINGKRAAMLSGYTVGYTLQAIAKDALDALKPGKNVIAVHCRQSRGGQFIDVGFGRIVR